MLTSPRAAAAAIMLFVPYLTAAQEAPARAASPAPAPGAAIVIGGGGDQPLILRKFIELAGGADAQLVVLPISTAQPNPGQAMAALLREHGARNVKVWIGLTPDAVDSEASLAELGTARGLYFGGGDQTRGMALLRGTKALEAIREAHRSGRAVIAGSSAGAALMSKVMIEGAPPEGALWPGRFLTSEGLGVTGNWITDQHFLARARLQRLINVLLDHPGYRGVGVDERTAAILTGDTIEVVGVGQVVLLEPPEGVSSRPTESRPLYRADTIRLRVLAPGDRVKL
jgi:cyanophycinase